MRFLKIFALCLVLFSVATSPLWAIDTIVTVRAKAHDAKFIGSSMGGVSVTIRANDSNQILAQGMITGGTGDTEILINQPISRNQHISQGGAAAFTTTLDLSEPTNVNIVVEGPLVGGTSATKQTKSIWLIPGHHMDGDGIIFEFYGLVVQPNSPLPNQSFKVGQSISLTTFVTMMCGCPIQKDSLWPSDQFSVEAWLIHDSGASWRINLPFTGETGIFGASWVVQKPGKYRIVFSAAQDLQKNYSVAYSGFAAK